MGKTLERYAPADIERGLQTLALHGNAYRASEACGIPRRTLDDWRRDRHADRYVQIREQLIPKIHAQIAAEAEDLARGYAELEARGLKSLSDNWDDLKPKEQADVLPKIATVKGINVDKALVMRDKPTSIVEHRTPEDILRKLSASGIADITDSTATEIEDAEVVAA